MNQHGYAASASDGIDGQCYRSAYNTAYDKAKKSAKGSSTATAAVAPAAKGKKFTKNLFSPVSGVICDTYGIKYCADGTGISASFTEQYLGPDAAKKLAEDMAGTDMSTFVLSNKVECRVKENACFNSKGGSAIAPVFTKVLFPDVDDDGSSEEVESSPERAAKWQSNLSRWFWRWSRFRVRRPPRRLHSIPHG